MLRLQWPPRDLDIAGTAAVRDLALTVGLWLLVISLSDGLGTRLLDRLRLPDLTSLERHTYGLALGLAALGYCLFALAMLGWLTTASVIGLLLALSWWLAPELGAHAQGLSGLPDRALNLWRSAKGLQRPAIVLASGIGLFTFLHALSPPWDYDGLMYHLLGPKQILEAGGIHPDIDNWYVNGPFTFEMLFSLGLAFGDDVLPKLLHLTAGVLLVVSTYTTAHRLLGPGSSSLAPIVVLGVPILPVWAAFAYVDLAWAAIEFLAVSSMLTWWRSGRRNWIMLSGVLIGIAMGIKYVALAGFFLLFIFVVIVSVRRGLRSTLGNLLSFSAVAALVASPWYLKNLIWFGNPVYPLYFGGPGWDPLRLSLYEAYLTSYGSGRGALQFLMLPWNIYAEHVKYGAVMNQIDIPSPLFPLAVIYLLRKRQPEATALMLLSVGRAALWFLGSQQTRFLLPIFPALAIVTACAIQPRTEPTLRRSPLKLFLPMLAVGLLALTLFYQAVIQLQFAPYKPVLGLESRRQFLLRIVKDYPAIDYAVRQLPGADRILLIGDGRGYYCVPRCVPDPDHFRWAAEISTKPDHAALSRWFEANGISHILMSWEDLDFLLQHDPLGVLEGAVRRLLEDEGPCMEAVYDDGWAVLYEYRCLPSGLGSGIGNRALR